MTLDKTDAAAALAEIEASRARSSTLYSYAQGAPYLFLTGLLWFVADSLIQFSPFNPNYIWPICSGAGTFVYIGIAVSQSRGRTRKAGASADSHLWRGFALWLIIFAFLASTFVLFYPLNGWQTHSFIGLFIGALYAGVGLWLGRRILALGVALAVLSVAGYFELREYYAIFMGVVGGGGMMLGAYWLRKA